MYLVLGDEGIEKERILVEKSGNLTRRKSEMYGLGFCRRSSLRFGAKIRGNFTSFFKGGLSVDRVLWNF